jgi:hypothetical protein
MCALSLFGQKGAVNKGFTINKEKQARLRLDELRHLYIFIEWIKEWFANWTNIQKFKILLGKKGRLCYISRDN